MKLYCRSRHYEQTFFARKAAWIVWATLILLIVAPCASATIIQGTLNFAVTSGGPTPTGSFVWNSTTQDWSLAVNWDGVIYDPTLSSSATLTDFQHGGTWCAAGASSFHRACPPALFQLRSPIGTFVTIPEAPSFANLDAAAMGSYTVTDTETVATPEPSSLGIMLLGLGILTLLWGLKRMGYPGRWRDCRRL